MSHAIAVDRLKRQSKILKEWGPWPVTLTVSRDLIAMAWGFDNWGEVVALSKRATAQDQRLILAAKDALSPHESSNLNEQLCSLTHVIQSVNVFAPRMYPQRAKMLIDALYGHAKPFPFLAITNAGDYIFQAPASWGKDNDELDAALHSQEDGLIRLACEQIIRRSPAHLEALTVLAETYSKKNDWEKALNYSSAAFSVCEQAMGPDFDPMNSEVQWGFIQNRPFHRAMYVRANILYDMGKRREPRRLLKSIYFMNPNDNIGVRYHDLITENDVKEADKRRRRYERRELRCMAELNGISEREMTQRRRDAEHQARS